MEKSSGSDDQGFVSFLPQSFFAHTSKVPPTVQPLILAAVAGCAPPFRPSQSHRPVHHEFHELQLEDINFKFVHGVRQEDAQVHQLQGYDV